MQILTIFFVGSLKNLEKNFKICVTFILKWALLSKILFERRDWCDLMFQMPLKISKSLLICCGIFILRLITADSKENRTILNANFPSTSISYEKTQFHWRFQYKREKSSLLVSIAKEDFFPHLFIQQIWMIEIEYTRNSFSLN